MKNDREKSTIMDYFLWIALGIALIGYLVYNTAQGKPYLQIVAVGLLIYISISSYLKNFVKDDEEEKIAAKKRKEEETVNKQINQIFYNNQYPDRPFKLNSSQWQQMGSVMDKARSFLSQYHSRNVYYELTDEEMYCLLFIKKVPAPFKAVMNFKNRIVDIYFRYDSDKKVLICTGGLDVIMASQPPKKYQKPVDLSDKKKKKSTGLIAARKRHKVKIQAQINNKKVEKKRQVQPPNYEFLAKEWLALNLGTISKKISDAFTAKPGETQISIELNKTELPTEEEVLKLVLKQMKEDKLITRYGDCEDGIAIRVKK